MGLSKENLARKDAMTRLSRDARGESCKVVLLYKYFLHLSTSIPKILLSSLTYFDMFSTSKAIFSLLNGCLEHM